MSSDPQNLPKTPSLLSAAEARDALGGISRATLYRLIARGEIGVVKVASRTMFEPIAVNNFIARHRRYPLSPDGKAPDAFLDSLDDVRPAGQPGEVTNPAGPSGEDDSG